MPKDFVILGSNDDITWTLLKSVTGGTAVEDVYHSLIVNANRSYKYYVWLTSAINGSSPEVVITELKFYGHRENDLVRLPDPTNVLKYPHVALSGPAQRGYVTNQSNYSGFPTDGYAWRLFDNTDGQYQSAAVYSNGVAGGSTPTTNDTDNGTHQGVHITLTLPHKIQLQSVNFKSHTYYARAPASGTFLGSNDNSAWDVIGTFSGIETTSAGQIHTVNIANYASKSYYKYIRLVVTHTSYSITARAPDGGSLLEFRRLEYYGTEENSSVPIQIGGGNIDKVANFRVYDTFIGEDQALEIWDAQKDTFRGVKNSVTLHKGRLGIGTTEPEGRLAVLDEPNGLEEFPPGAMTGYKNYFEGHGEFCVRESSSLTVSATEDYLGWEAFDKNPGSIWYSNEAYHSGVYQGSSQLASETSPGSWLVLEMPYKIYPKKVQLYGRNNGAQLVSAAIYYAKAKLEDTWTAIHTQTSGPTNKGATPYIGVINSSVAYQYFAIVVTSSNPTGNDTPSISNLVFFGTREQGQSVLHDGQLTLTKSLTVPRIGPALDADDTPRRDRLVVEYNTSTNPTFEGAVRDTSGRGVDGIMHTATYNATEKAIESNGNTGTFNNGPGGSASGNLNDYGSFETILPSSLQGNPVLTVSGWFKQNTIADLQLMWLVGRNLRVTAQPGMSNKMHWFGITSTGRPRIALGGGGNLNLYYTDGSIKAGTWHHVVVVIEPTGTDITQNHVRFYLDGVHQTTSNTGSSGTIDLGDGAPPRMHWFWQEAADVYYNGSASSLKIHDVALTAEEVKTLYDMGRLSNAVKTPLQIEAPVDIRGDIRYITNIRPLPLRTMWDHETNGHFTRGIYPITGTQGGSKVYNMLCEPDWCGGGWMCAAQLPRGKDVVTTTINLFEDEYGDPSNLTWSNDFAIPMNIFSNNSGYDLDVMLVLLGGPQAGRAGAGGARNGGIYRGVNLTQALNTGWPTNGVYPANISTSGLASSADGYTFVSRTPVSGGNFQPYKANGGWRLSFSSEGGFDMAYNDNDINTMGWLVHTAGNNLQYTYSYVHGGGGSQDNIGNTDWVAVRFFVRPKRY
jgi:hypothetical protein